MNINGNALLKMFAILIVLGGLAFLGIYYFWLRPSSPEGKIRKNLDSCLAIISKSEQENEAVLLLKLNKIKDLVTPSVSVLVGKDFAMAMTPEEVQANLMRFRSLLKKSSAQISDLAFTRENATTIRCVFLGEFKGALKNRGDRFDEAGDVVTVWTLDETNNEWRMSYLNIDMALHF